MEVVKSLIVIAMGFLVGLCLAGAGGLSAEAFFSQFKANETNKKIESYWADTALGYSDAEALISNLKCQSSKLYAKACLNAVIQPQITYNYRIFNYMVTDDAWSAITSEELTEKELLEIALNKNIQIDYDKILKQTFQSTAPELRSALVADILNSFLSVYHDPHTYILPINYYNQVGVKSERSPYFIGISYSYTKKTGSYFIEKVAINSDAARAGLRPQDKIISINRIDLQNLKYGQFSSILRDQKTKKYIFKIERNNQIINLELKRSYRLLNHAQYNKIGTNQDLALITISKFSDGVCAEVKSIIQKNKSDNWKALVLDLRDNPGGLLDEAACIEGLFLGPDRKAYYVEYRNEFLSNEVVLTNDEKIYDGPLIVLINHRSASSSELLAGALKDYKRATLIGRNTFGKGTFQEQEEWMQNSRVSLFKTQGYYLLPSRQSTQLVGVKPDIEVSTTEVEKREESIYVNPLNPIVRDYADLRKEELDFNPISVSCVRQTQAWVQNSTLLVSKQDHFFNDPVLKITENLAYCQNFEKIKTAQSVEIVSTKN